MVSVIRMRGIEGPPLSWGDLTPGAGKEVRKVIPVLPFCHLRLSARIPPARGYTLELKTLGDHLKKRKKRRMGMGLRQRGAAERLGVSQGDFL